MAGILLAAGKGSRFDPTGMQNKLAQTLPCGDTIAVKSAKNLLSVLSRVIAVVHPDAMEVASALRDTGCTVVQCPHADAGMGASLAYALSLSQAQDATGWVIALADMPAVSPHTIRALVDAIGCGASIAVPVHEMRRGNPVAFGVLHLPRLLRLTGDKGARDLLTQYPVSQVLVSDPGIHQDVDIPEDLSWTGACSGGESTAIRG